jgi:ABC-2 type transport system ATP-binding protein
MWGFHIPHCGHLYNAGMSHTIRCRNLVKTYPGNPPVEAVCGLDLDVRAGKTPTQEIIEGLLDATTGEVEML